MNAIIVYPCFRIKNSNIFYSLFSLKMLELKLTFVSMKKVFCLILCKLIYWHIHTHFISVNICIHFLFFCHLAQDVWHEQRCSWTVIWWEGGNFLNNLLHIFGIINQIKLFEVKLFELHENKLYCTNSH